MVKILKYSWAVILRTFILLLIPLAALKYLSVRVTRTHLTHISLNLSKVKSISEWESHFWDWGKSPVTINLITRMKKPLPTKNEKLRHARNSVETAWTNESKSDLKWLWRRMVVIKNLRNASNKLAFLRETENVKNSNEMIHHFLVND